MNTTLLFFFCQENQGSASYNMMPSWGGTSTTNAFSLHWQTRDWYVLHSSNHWNLFDVSFILSNLLIKKPQQRPRKSTPRKVDESQKCKSDDTILSNTHLTCRDKLKQNQSQFYALTSLFFKPQIKWKSCSSLGWVSLVNVTVFKYQPVH